MAVALGLMSLAWTGARLAEAQDTRDVPTASVLRTSASGPVDSDLAEAVDRLVRAQLDAVHVLRITGSVVLDLADVQLALGCVGETDACLTAAAREIEVDALVLPSLVRTGDDTVVSIGLFRSGRTPGLRRVAVRVRGAGAATEALEAIDGLLRQLFPEARFPRHDAGAGIAPGAGARAGGGSRLSPWPVVVASVGVAALATGVGFGLASQSAQHDYASSQLATAGDVDTALAHLDDARSSATVANVLFVAGAVVLSAGVAWGAFELAGRRGGERASACLAPVLGPNVAGVAVGGEL